MQHYESYKPSGLDWLGDIPSHWSLKKSKFLWREKEDRSLLGDEELLSVSQYSGVVPRTEDSRSESLEDYKRCEPNDLVINIMLAWMSGLGISKYSGIVSPAYCVYRQLEDHNPAYFDYQYRTPQYLAEFARRSKGIVPSRWRMYTEDFGQVLSLLPSRGEQDRIVEFLDQKTAEIDAAIAKKERLIELLLEQKSILINEAVTKGLSPNTTMVDTELEWLGEIPAHWKLEKVKSLFRLVIDPAPPNNDCELLSIYTDIGVRPRKDLKQKGNRASTTDGYWRVKEGDFIVNKLLAWMGAIGLSNYSGVTSPAYDILRPRRNLDGNYYHHLFRTKRFSSELKRWSRGIMEMRLRLYFEDFGPLVVPNPPVKEQREITKWVLEIESQVDLAVSKVQQEISLLAELKANLVSEVVTGQLKI